MKAEQQENCKKKHGKKLFIVLAIAGTVAMVAALYPACGHRSWHRAKDPEKVAGFVKFRVDDFLDDLDATDQQRETFQLNTDAIVADWMTMRQERVKLHEQLLNEIKKPSPDADVLKGMIDQKMVGFKERAYRTVDLMLVSYETLDQDQRAVIVAKFEEHMKKHQEE